MKRMVLTMVVILSLIGIVIISGCIDDGKKSLDYSGGEVFKYELEVDGLKANNEYVLCINGKPGFPGNDILYEHYQRWGREGYYDFKTVKSDDKGNLHDTDEVDLPEGKYDVKFAIKELPNYKWIEISSSVVFEIKKSAS